MNKKFEENISLKNECNIEEINKEKLVDKENDNIKIILDMVVFIIINTIVCLGWQRLEILLIGEIRPNNVDSIIGLILTFSLFGNYRHYRKKFMQ